MSKFANVDLAESDSKSVFVEAEVKITGKKSIPVRTKLHIPKKSVGSSVSPTRWKEKMSFSTGKPLRQENAFSVIEKVFNVPKPETLRDAHKTNTLSHTEGMDCDLSILSETLSNDLLCREIKFYLNKRRGLAHNHRGVMALMTEYMLSLEWFNLCRSCYQPIRTKKARIENYLKISEDNFVKATLSTKNTNGILGGKSVTIKRGSEKVTIYKGKGKFIPTFSTTKHGEIVEYADIPSHSEIRMLSQDEKTWLPFNAPMYLRCKTPLRVFKVEATRLERIEQCNCFAKEIRKVENADKREQREGSI